jgi:RNA-directed DNA polymerase
LKPILSVRDLARRLKTSVERLRQIADEIARDFQSHYRFWSEKNKKTGKIRHYRIPKPELKEIQRRIKNNVLGQFELHDSAHGGIRGRSPHSNASKHLGQAWVITMDVKSFFPNVRHYIVYRLFRHELGCGNEVAYLLTRLTTLQGQLPQGAPTSTAIANLLLTKAVDVPVSRRALEIGAEYTRFVDDFSFSGHDPRTLINDAARALSRKRLPIWRKTTKFQPKPKLKIMPRSKRQEVTGLIVNSRT